MFYSKFVLLMNKNYKIKNYDLVSRLKIFLQFLISNVLGLIMSISEIKRYYYFFFKFFFNKSILANRI